MVGCNHDAVEWEGVDLGFRCAVWHRRCGCGGCGGGVCVG